MAVQHAFRITDPAAMEVWRAAHDARDEWLTAVLAAAERLHPDAKPYGPESRHSGVCRIDGIVGPDVPWEARRQAAKDTDTPRVIPPNFRLDPVPDGWRWTESRECYRPRQGKPGAPARVWLAELPASKPNARVQVIKHLGMPTDVYIGSHVYWPGVMVLNDVLWVVYGVRLDADPGEGMGSGRSYMPDPLPDGVVEVKLSEFHAAKEADEERREAEKASA